MAPATASTPAPREPTTGPANAMTASSNTFLGIYFIAITVPMNGMNTAGENGTP